MQVVVVLKYLFPRPLSLWLVAAAVVAGHLPLLLIPRLLSPAENLLLSGCVCVLFLIRTRLSFFYSYCCRNFLSS
ncbi:hypothetical protein [Morganella morganii]|uniref:hypothetical protein n=1 Tax=Morganella morganii TaxID=582 RepID=UPI001FFCBDED|nr:hypothetical protein [Morganella morganii]